MWEPRLVKKKSAITVHEDEEGVDVRANSSLGGWIECFPKACLAGTVFTGGVNGVGEIDGQPALE